MLTARLRTVLSALLALTTLALPRWGGAQILTTDSATLETNPLTAATPIQDLSLRPDRAGIYMDGSVRRNPPTISLAGNPFERSASSNYNGVDLFSGTFDRRWVDLSGAGWVHVREYNARQELSSSDHDSDGPMGENWAHTSQPELMKTGSGADERLILTWGMAYYVFERTGASTDYYTATNGANGVFEFEEDTMGVDTYRLTTPRGDQLLFFGFDTSGNTHDGQFWKHLLPDDTHSNDADNDAVFAGSRSSKTDAITDGYHADGTIESVTDLEGFEFAYTYTSGHLTKVERKNGSGTVIDKVEYSFTGDELDTATRTTDLSDASEDLVQVWYYRYNTSGLLEMMVDPEGARRALQIDALANFSDSDLKPYTSAHITEYSSRQVTKAYFNGQCGCSGGGGNGEVLITYDPNGSFSETTGTYDYDTAGTAPVKNWQSRTSVKFVDTDYDDVETFTYFDDVGQAATRVQREASVADIPEANARHLGGTDQVVGFSAEVIGATGANSYDHATGEVTKDPTEGKVAKQLREDTGTLTGFRTMTKLYAGDSVTNETIDSVAYTTPSRQIGSGPTIYMPYVDSRTVHVDDSTSHTTSTEFVFVSDSLIPQLAHVTYPAVSHSNNGSASSATSSTYYDDRGRVSFTKSPTGVIGYRTYDDAGRVLVSVVDADTGLNGGGEIFDGITIPSFTTPDPEVDFDSTGTPAHLVTTRTYDELGRLKTVIAPDETVSEYHHTILSSGERVTITVPRRTGSGPYTFYGPVSASVRNQAGRVTEQATIALSSGSTSTALASWIDTSKANLVAALAGGIGSVARLNVTVYDDAGSRVESTRSYFDIPTTMPGTEGTHYDETTYAYSDVGQQIAMTSPTGTISRTVYDDLGRAIEQWIGTNDTSATAFDPTGGGAGGNNMVKVSSTEYPPASNGIATHLVQSRTQYLDDTGTNTRVTSFTYNNRDLLKIQENPTAPHTMYAHDYQGRVIATGLYSSEPTSGNPATVATDRLALTESAFDERGRVWKTTRHEVDASDGSLDAAIENEMWYDDNGRVIKTEGEQITKTEHDALGRPVASFILAAHDDGTAKNTTTYGYADDVTGDTVLQETRTYFETETGLPLMRTVIERHWDDLSTTGSLNDTDGLPATVDADTIKGRPQITAMWYDDERRLVDTVLLGTFDDKDYTRTASAPTRSESALRATTAYSNDGTVLSITDPLDLETRYDYDDAGRQTLVILNYVNGTPSGATGDDDLHTRYEFTDGLQTKMWVDIDGDGTEDSDDQVTTYSYGSTKGTSSGQSAIAAGHVLDEVAYPDSASASDVVNYAYNALGEQAERIDQAGNVFDMTFDDAGRITTVTISAVASGFDDTVRRIETAYDDLGRVTTVKQYDATTSGNLLNTVTNAYDGWGNLTDHDQDHDTPAGPASHDYQVSYAYTESDPSGGWNTIRRTGMDVACNTWSTDLDYGYGGTGLINDLISRTRKVSIGATNIAAYFYNGVGTLIKTNLPEPDVFYSLDGSTARSYDRLDAFNRVTKSVWTKDLSTDVDFYSLDVTWDEGSNVTRQEDDVHLIGSGNSNGRFDEAYEIDDLNRLTSYERGHWNDTAITGALQGEEWILDQLGSWDIHKLDLTGDGDYVDTDEFQDSRTHNTVNELTSRDLDTDNDGSYDDGNYDLVYDAVGNLTDDGEDYEYVYDPIGRLVAVYKRGDTIGVDDPISDYAYDGLSRRIAFRHDEDADDDIDDDHWFHLAYDERWRVVATFRDADDEPKEYYAHHAAGLSGSGVSSYADSLILRDKDADTDWAVASDGALEDRIYYCQNWRADVSVVLTDAGTVHEWIKYDPYGTAFNIPLGDVNSDGDTGGSDLSYENALQQGTYSYDVRGDMDLDGDIEQNSDYLSLFLPLYYAGASGGRGVLSQHGIGNVRGYAGYLHDAAPTDMYHVRSRVYSTGASWLRRDPLFYADGPSLYSYVGQGPVIGIDPAGTSTAYCDGTWEPILQGDFRSHRGSTGPWRTVSRWFKNGGHERWLTPWRLRFYLDGEAHAWAGNTFARAEATGDAGFEGGPSWGLSYLFPEVWRDYSGDFFDPSPLTHDVKWDVACNEADLSILPAVGQTLVAIKHHRIGKTTVSFRGTINMDADDRCGDLTISYGIRYDKPRHSLVSTITGGRLQVPLDLLFFPEIHLAQPAGGNGGMAGSLTVLKRFRWCCECIGPIVVNGEIERGPGVVSPRRVVPLFY